MRTILLTCLLFLATGAFAQDSTKAPVSAEVWSSISAERDYTESYKTKKPEPKEQNNPSSSTKSDFRLGESRFLIYFIVVIVLILIVVRILSKFQKNDKIEESSLTLENLKTIEEKLQDYSLDDLLAQAISKKEYRIALRLNFLILIKLLSQSGRIKWKKEKTNWEYHAEIRDRLLADQFREAIINFEGFWYGEHPLSESSYFAAEPVYTSLRKKLNTNEKKQ